MNELGGRGFVAIWNGVTPGTEADFEAWHQLEHMPERLDIPGFLRGTRWGSESAQPRYFTLYELDDARIARSGPYLDRLNAPTEWTRRVMDNFRDNSRCVGSFTASLGTMPGRTAVVMRLEGKHDGTTVNELAHAIMDIDGITGCHIGETDTDASGIDTVERQGRTVSEPWGLVLIALEHDMHQPILASIQARLPKTVTEIAVQTIELQMAARARDV